MKLTQKGLQVLAVFMIDPREAHSGAALAKLAGVGSGTLYPLLSSFEKHGVLTSWWEDVDPRSVKRPRKRFYKITSEGQNTALAARSELQKAGGLSWAF